MFKENNPANVSFLELLTKENLLGCFHWPATYQKRRPIFAHQKFLEKTTCKQREFFDHQNDVEKD